MSDLTQVVENGLDQVKSQVDGVRTDLQKQLDDLAQQVTTPSGFARGKAKTIGAQVAGSEQIKALQSGNVRTASIPTSVHLKAIVGDAGGVDDDAYPVQTQRSGMMGEAPRRRLSLLDMLPIVQATSNSFEFVSLDGFVNAAGYQLTETGEKPEQSLPTALKTAPVVTIAAYLRASEQVLADAPGLVQFIDAHMRHAIRSKLESEVVNGAGGTGQINGLLAQATAWSGTVTSMADDIGAAMVEMQANGWNPGAIVMSPAQWHSIRSERADTGNGQYVAGGWASPDADTMWGVPVVTTPSMIDGQVLVIDPSQVALLDRQQIATVIDRAGNDLIENAVTMRTEIRSGIAVFSPSAVVLLDNTGV